MVELRCFLSDVDECISNPCGANTDCSNVVGSFRCSCKEGYKMVNGSNQIGAILCIGKAVCSRIISMYLKKHNIAWTSYLQSTAV